MITRTSETLNSRRARAEDPPEMRARLQLRKERGFTLVEALVVMAMMSLVMAGVTSIFVSGMQTQSKLTQEFTAEENLHVGVDKLRLDVNLACGETAESATSITLSDPPCTAPSSVTWCTAGIGSAYGLYRYTTGSTCTDGVEYAGYLTSGSIFTYTAPDASGSNSLALLHVDLTVNAAPTTGGTDYHEVDDLAFRNGARQ